ncbi:MAG: DEAD/DEAH box helicase, partial [Bdellovibrionota bacterium]
MKYTELKLHPKVQDSVASQNYETATPIQVGVIPHILSGHDIAGLAQTGTGKTAAFLVPIMDRIIRSIEAAELKKTHGASSATASDTEAAPEVVAEPAPEVEKSHLPPTAPTENRPIFENWRSSQFVLILVPTRELAEQVSENAVKLGGPLGFKTATIYGGTSYETQKAALKQGVQFIVATPGRLIDLYKEHLVDLNQVRAIIFDEADRMFDMGFKDDMKFILRRVPKDRQFLVFSATLNFDVLNTAYEFGANPVEVNVSRDQAKADNVKDELFHVGHYDKPQSLLSILQQLKPRQVIIFSNFKHNV